MFKIDVSRSWTWIASDILSCTSTFRVWMAILVMMLTPLQLPSVHHNPFCYECARDAEEWKCEIEFTKPWMLSHFSESRDHSYVGTTMLPQCPTQDWRDKSCWLHPRESGPEVVQRLGRVTTSPALLSPVLVWSQLNYVKLPLTVRYS